ncbi:hypothetical protein IJT17_09350 [bacterium]|nr:hypothetical protein [bacterium]
MKRLAKCFMYSLLALTAFSNPARALELGDRAPKLSLENPAGEALSLSYHTGPAPTMVWFPLAGRTPMHLCDKLVSVAQANQASLVIIPIFDADSFKRVAAESNASVQEKSGDAASPEGEAAASAPAAAPLEPAKSAPDSSAVQSDAKDSAPTASVPPDDADKTPSDIAEPSQETSPDASPEAQDPQDAAAQAQASFKSYVAQLAQEYPQAAFACDIKNSALMLYTDSYATNILPNPNFFIVDAQGFIAWKAFYPGLTVGTLTRAILSTRTKQSRT